MSGSTKKKLRKDQLDEKHELRQKNEAKRKRTLAIQTAIILIVALLIVVVVVINSNFFYTTMTAVRIGDTNYTASEFNYFYNSAYSDFMNQYGDIAAYLIDTSKPLDSQPSAFSEEQTWAEYFEESALSTMRRMTFQCDEAQKAGFELSQEGKDVITSNMDGLRTSFASSGYSTIGQFTQAVYGKGASVKMVEKLLTKLITASEYSQQVVEAYEYSSDDLEAYYTEKKDTYDYLTYRQFFISGAADEEAGIDAETAMAEAREKAEAMAAASVTEDEFAVQALENTAEESKASYEDPTYTLARAQGANLTAVYSEWLLDSDRVAGDCEAIEDTSGYYVVMFLDREDNHYNTRSVRHILIQAIADADGNYTDEAKAEALAILEEIQAEWEAGEATEDSFAELANLRSEDTGSNTNGGLYEEIFRGQMVQEFDLFTFNEGRKPGDTEIVYGESGSYAGYHMVYYVGEGDSYSDVLAKIGLENDDYASWIETGIEGYQAVTRFTFRFTK